MKSKTLDIINTISNDLSHRLNDMGKFHKEVIFDPKEEFNISNNKYVIGYGTPAYIS